MSIDILADEGVNFSIVRGLRDLGSAVTSVAEQFLGARDNQVLEYSVDNDLLLLTEDRDYGELEFAPKQKSVGVLFVRHTKAEETTIVDAPFEGH